MCGMWKSMNGKGCVLRYPPALKCRITYMKKTPTYVVRHNYRRKWPHAVFLVGLRGGLETT